MKIPKGLTVRRARNGVGIFAARSFPASTRLFEVTGKKVQCLDDDDMDEVERDNTFRYSLNWYISPTNSIGKFLNHSCKPNAALRKIGTHLYIVSVEPIAAGAEIVVDYSTFTASDDVWELKCNCGEKMCRKKVGNIKTLPKALRASYRTKKIIPSYIH
jgi:SET domain-containing protein